MAPLRVANGPFGPRTSRPYTGPNGLSYGLVVKQGATDTSIAAVGAAAQAGLGITEETDIINQGTYGVTTWGETIGIAGAAIAAGTPCIADANGNLIPSAAQGDNVVGIARTSTTAANQEVVIFVNPYIR